MTIEGREPFTVRHRRTIALSTPVLSVILSVLFYQVTMPRSAQSADSEGRDLKESQLLQVGALPVT